LCTFLNNARLKLTEISIFQKKKIKKAKSLSKFSQKFFCQPRKKALSIYLFVAAFPFANVCYILIPVNPRKTGFLCYLKRGICMKYDIGFYENHEMKG